MRNSSKVKKVVHSQRQIIKDMHKQIKVLYLYKILHDILQRDLQTIYNAIDGERKCLQALHDKSQEKDLQNKEGSSWDIIKNYEPKLQKIRKEILNNAQSLSFTPSDKSWITLIGTAETQLFRAVRDKKIIDLNIGIDEYKRVLENLPSRISNTLYQKVDTLPLSRLSDVLTDVLKNCLDFSETDEQVINNSINALNEINDRLQSLVNNHESWQFIDDTLHTFQFDKDYTLDELKIKWKGLEEINQQLCSRSADDWARSVSTITDDIKAAFDANNIEKANENFCLYRKQSLDCFTQTDSNLLSLCENLQEGIYKPLDNILRRIP